MVLEKVGFNTIFVLVMIANTVNNILNIPNYYN